MPGAIVANGDHEGKMHKVNGGIGKPSSHIRKTSISHMSPRSPLSPQWRRHGSSCPKISVNLDSEIAWAMHSSDHSPSITSFGSYGNEPRIDTVVPNLVRVRTHLVDIKIGGVSSSEASPRIGSPYSSPTPKKQDKASMSQLGPETPARSVSKVRTPTSKPPVDRKNGNHMRKQSTSNKSTNSGEYSPIKTCSPRAAFDRPELAPLFLKQARDLMSLGDNLRRLLNQLFKQ